MATVPAPPVVRQQAKFDPSHPNRFATDGSAGAPSGGLISKKDRFLEELGIEDEGPHSSEEDEDEDPGSGDFPSRTASSNPGARSSEAVRARMTRLQDELNELSDKLSKV